MLAYFSSYKDRVATSDTWKVKVARMGVIRLVPHKELAHAPCELLQ